MKADNAFLEASHVRFQYGQRDILSDASLSIAAGEIIALLGCNGAGKSTFLRILLGLLAPHAGSVVLDGKALSAYRPRELATRIAYVPQVHVTPFPYTVRDVVLLGRLPANGILHAPSRYDIELVEDMLSRLDIVHLAGRPYTDISGGERQLTLLARALVQGARILIMDEPMNGLDYGRQIRLLERLQHLAADGYAILMTTHHPEHALLAATRVAVLTHGRIDADGPPSDIVTPATIRKLYGVTVRAFHSSEGHTAFHPAPDE